MGLFGKLFGEIADCPACREPGAKVSLFGITCAAPGCMFYSAAYADQAVRSGAVHWSQLPPVAFGQSIDIEYTNYLGEQKTFTCDRQSLRARGRHLSARVAPTGRRIALKIGSIRDLEAIKPYVVAS